MLKRDFSNEVNALIVVFIFLALALFIGVVFTVQKMLFYGQLHYLIYFLCFFLPFYLTLQALFYQYTGSTSVVSLIRYLKEIMLFLALFTWLLYRKNVLTIPLNITFLDYLFLAFVGYALLFVVLPVGPAFVIDKLLYFKNMLMLALMYFFGRLIFLSSHQMKQVLRLICTVTICAFVLGFLEKVTNTHFQSLIGYAQLNQDVNGIDPTGAYGLTYTFGAASGAKRFAAFFSNPLEMAAGMLICFSSAFILFKTSRYQLEKKKYILISGLAILTLLLAYSRSSLLGFFLLVFFIAIILGYYRLLLLGFAVFVTLFIGIFLFAGDDLRFFVIDSFNLADPSSAAHIIEWIEGIESIVSNPLGIGLGTSGNSGGVDPTLQVGGENQFIIFGVQLGVPFLLLYLTMIVTAIVISVRAYKRAITQEERLIPFVAATFKFAFLLPLMTANSETYLFVAYLSWWMVGVSATLYQKNKTSPSFAGFPIDESVAPLKFPK